MSKFRANESAVVHGFQSYYYELLRQKEKALSMFFSSHPIDTENQECQQTAEVEGLVVQIQKRLVSIIQNTYQQIRMDGKLAPRYFEDVQYILAVFTDEIFLNLQWEGAKFWRYNILEKQIFQTEQAGDKFFNMLDDTIGDNQNEEMAFLYLMSLSLGFKGKYRDMENSENQLSWYKNRLCSILNSKPSKLFFPGRKHLIQSCYDSTNTSQNTSSLPDVKFWTWCISFVVVAYVIISFFVWNNISGEIGTLVKNITTQIRNTPLI